MKFFNSFVNSLYNIHWLREQKHKPKKPWKYFFLLILFIGLAHLIIAGTVGSRHINTAWQEISGGMDLEDSTQVDFGEVVDTFSKALQEAQEEGLTITTEDGEVIEIDAETVGEALGEDGEMIEGQLELLGESVENLQVESTAIGSMVVTFLIFLGIISPVFLVAGKLLYLLILSWLFSLLSRSGEEKWSTGEFFGVGLYALTLPTLLNWLVLPWFGEYIPYLYTFIMIIFFGGILFWKKGKEKV